MPAINVQLPDGAKSLLEKDETVLWAGETKPYPLISAQNRSRLFLRGQRLRVCRIKNALRLLCCRIALIAVGPAAASGEHKDRV